MTAPENSERSRVSKVEKIIFYKKEKQ